VITPDEAVTSPLGHPDEADDWVAGLASALAAEPDPGWPGPPRPGDPRPGPWDRDPRDRDPRDSGPVAPARPAPVLPPEPEPAVATPAAAVPAPVILAPVTAPQPAVAAPPPRPRPGTRLHRADLSHVIEDGMNTYPGLPVARISPDGVSAHARAGYAPGVQFQVGEVTLCGSTGTFLASPAHRHPDADDLSELPLDKVADLDGLVIDLSGSDQRAIGRAQLVPFDCYGKAVLIRTGWDRHWGSSGYFRNHPFLTADAATFLAGTGAVLVGIDSLSIDDTGDPQRPVHTLLLGAGIPVCEHLTNLGALPPDGFRFSAVPPRLRPLSTFPVRAFATWAEEPAS
jgi:kynurenine formamidase